MRVTPPVGRPRVPATAIGLLLAATVGVQAFRDRVTPPPGDAEQLLWLQSPEVARRMALTFDDIAADVYWMRAIVHYGTERRGPAERARYALLYPLLDLTTSLDPHFDVAARLGAIFLSEGFPGGPGRPDQAIALLKKGLAHEPERWQYVHDIAFVEYWWLKDYTTAAAHFEEASRLPGAPTWLKTLAGAMLLQGGDRAAARTLWSELYANAEADWMRQAAAYRLSQLRALDDIDALQALVVGQRERTGVPPASWRVLVTAGLLQGPPVDPAGVEYALGPDGAVTLGSGSPLRPLPTLRPER
jgi:tetratricopeptide (TPR) repeat protein